MKATGITRRIDSLGRMVLPVELRRKIGIDIGNPLEFFVDGESIVLRRYHGTEITNHRIVEDLKRTLHALGEEEAVEAVDKALKIMQEEKDPCYDVNY